MKYFKQLNRMSLDDLNNLLGVKDYCSLESRNLQPHIDYEEKQRFKRW